ncbi:hypothetical protein LCGC14_0921650 [marine sediment metagenome]|uniref:Uncharacterized protein n=1 Tax=marine sediment metagenome TaxID=412755 RepID=A0A0F9RXC1_9ZZZZ
MLLPLLPILADAASIGKDVLAVVGVLASVGATIFVIWFALRRRADAKRQQEHKDDIELSDRFIRLETQVGSIDRQYTDFRDSVLSKQRELVRQIDELRARSDDHQTAANITTLKQDVQRMQDQLTQLDQEFSRHRDQVVEKYLTLASYQNDLILWTSTFDDLRQSLRDVQQTLTKRGSK